MPGLAAYSYVVALAYLAAVPVAEPTPTVASPLVAAGGMHSTVSSVVGAPVTCNFTVDAGTGEGFNKGVLRGGAYFHAVSPATDPVASASVAGCAALCCATDGCRAYSLNAPWSLGSAPDNCQQGSNCCSLASNLGPMRNNTYAMNITTGVVQAPLPPGWRVQKDFFCHPGVVDARLHKNSTPGKPATMAQCEAICVADSSCHSFAFTNDNWEGTRQGQAWCFSPETDCPNHSGKCPGGCANFDTFYNPAYLPPKFNLSEALTSHMVIQQKPAKAQLWGWGVPGTKIVLQEAQLSTVVGVDGGWLMALPPLEVNPSGVFGTGNLTLVGGTPPTKVVLTDVLVGEVWMCTGQSNMGITLSGLGAGPTGSEPVTSWSGDVSDGAAEIANSTSYPLVRVVVQADSALAAPTEHANTGAGWRVPSPANMGPFSAVCWMFGRRLQTHLGVPVGLIQNDVGGTAVERWSSAEALSKCDQGRATKMAKCKPLYKEGAEGDNNEDRAAAVEAALQGGGTSIPGSAGDNSTLYNGMISPWVNTAVRGAIWYQGESNVACNDKWPYMQGLNCAMSGANCASYYGCQFPAMIEDWRTRFAAPWAGTPHELTFLYVGLPAYVQDLPSMLYDRKIDASLPLLRLAQAAAEVQDHTFGTTLIDHGFLFGHYGSIHPMDKTPVGKRLFLSAREHAYGETGIISTGPAPLAAKHAGGSVTLTFDPKTVGSAGLLLRTDGPVRQQCPLGQKQISGNPTNAAVPQSQCGPATGFSVATASANNQVVWHDIVSMEIGQDRKSRHQLVLKLPAVAAAAPEKLRYLFADWPTPTVYNADSFLGLNGELPTPPFEMDIVSGS